MSKKLFILIQDCGDGSFGFRYTMNEKWIAQQQEKYDNGELEYDSIGCDSDGFHFDMLEVPDDCTLNSLGISWDCAE